MVSYGLALYFNNPFVPFAGWAAAVTWTVIYMRSSSR